MFNSLNSSIFPFLIWNKIKVISIKLINSLHRILCGYKNLGIEFRRKYNLRSHFPFLANSHKSSSRCRRAWRNLCFFRFTRIMKEKVHLAQCWLSLSLVRRFGDYIWCYHENKSSPHFFKSEEKLPLLLPQKTQIIIYVGFDYLFRDTF